MSLIGRGLAWAEERGRDRGLRGSSGTWTAIWLLALGYRTLKRWYAPRPVVAREVLQPGQQLVISHYPSGAEPEQEPARRRRSRR